MAARHGILSTLTERRAFWGRLQCPLCKVVALAIFSDSSWSSHSFIFLCFMFSLSMVDKSHSLRSLTFTDVTQSIFRHISCKTEEIIKLLMKGKSIWNKWNSPKGAKLNKLFILHYSHYNHCSNLRKQSKNIKILRAVFQFFVTINISYICNFSMKG